MPARGLHDRPTVMPRYRDCSQLLQALYLFFDRIRLNIEMISWIVIDPLNDDLDLPRPRLKLNELITGVRVLWQWATERSTPELRLSQQVVCMAINDDVPKATLVHESSSLCPTKTH
jgi:hypothetical protein